MKQNIFYFGFSVCHSVKRFVLIALTVLMCFGLLSCAPEKPVNAENDGSLPSDGANPAVVESPQPVPDGSHAEEPLPTPEKPDAEEPLPTPEEGPTDEINRLDTQAVLDYLDAAFADGGVDMWAFLLPGTGPISVSLDGYYEQVRSVFAAYNWTQTDEVAPSVPHTSEIWQLWLVDNHVCKADIWSNSNQVVLGYDAADASERAVGYTYDGEAGALSDALANLWHAPEFRYALVLLPVEGQDNQTLMLSYEKEFQEMYLNSGAVTDYELHELTLLSEGDVEGGSQDPFFKFSYSVKPSNTSAHCWRNYVIREDGWVDISVEVNLSLTGYGDADTVWRCGFWQWPNNKE